jgi:hypothetical protein
VSQTWFPGVHSDVGGGYAEVDLSDAALQWMIDNATVAGLAFDAGVITAQPLSPRPTGTMHNSKTGLYRATRGVDRPIGVGPTQTIHASAVERWDRDATYRPPNLREYFQRVGDGRASG